MKIHTSFNPVAGENTYYLENDTHLIIIDPGSDWSTIEQTISQLQKPISAILLTHTHYDHIMSVDLVREHFNHPPVYVAESEADWLYTPTLNLSGLDRHSDMLDVLIKPAEHFFNYHQPYDLDDFHFYVLPTPGHSIGGVSFVFDEDELVVTGDALFRETVGRSDLYTGNYAQLISGIKAQLLTLPKHYNVYPGHGKPTTIAHEINYNPHLQA